MLRTSSLPILCLLLAAHVSGCKAVSETAATLPKLDRPKDWTSRHSHLPEAPQAWLQDFEDEVLPELVSRGLEANHDLKGAAARLKAASARARIARADLAPDLEAGLGATRSQRVFNSGSERRNIQTTDFGLNLRISWELDVWGRLRDASSAAAQDYLAARNIWQAARLSLAAQIASGWFDSIQAGQQVRLATQTVDVFKKSQSIIEERFQRGVASALDVRLGRADVSNAESRLMVRQIELAAAVRLLEVILGNYPSSELKVVTDLPPVKQEVPVGLPSQLLVRRPDILVAELQLAASGHRLRGEKKNRLPSFQLTGSGGTATENFTQLLDLKFLVWNLGANLTQPVFRAGELKAKVSLAEAEKDEAVALYAQTALQAFREVETALTNENLLKGQELALETAVMESAEAEQLALDQYTQGTVDIITLLDSQRRTFDARNSLIQVRNQRLQNRLELYLALGGSFKEESK